MRLERVELFVLRMPLKRAYETSGSRETHQTRVICRAQAEGIAGWGESVAPEQPWYSGETPKTVWYALDEYIVPQLFRADLKTPEDTSRALGWIREHRVLARRRPGLQAHRRVHADDDRAAPRARRHRRPRDAAEGDRDADLPRRVDPLGRGRTQGDRDRRHEDREHQGRPRRRARRGQARARRLRRARGPRMVRRHARDGDRARAQRAPRRAPELPPPRRRLGVCALF